MANWLRCLPMMTALVVLTSGCASTQPPVSADRNLPPQAQPGPGSAARDADPGPKHGSKNGPDVQRQQRQSVVSERHFNYLRYSIAYNQLLQRTVPSNPEIAEALGTPITPVFATDYDAFLASGADLSLDQSDLVWELSASIPVAGPKGRGVLVYYAELPNRSTEVVREADFFIEQTGKWIELIQWDEPKTFTSGG